MGILREFRSSLENPSSPLSFPAEWLLDIFNGGRTDSGLRVSEMTALQVSTVFSCVNLISGAMGSLPLAVYEVKESVSGRTSKHEATSHDLYDMLANEPNDEMTSFTFRKTLQTHMLLWGNAYAEIQRDKANGAVALWPRNPARIRPQRSPKTLEINGEVVQPGELFYLTSEGREVVDMNPESPAYPSGPERPIHRNDILHVPGLALDGRLGQSMIWLMRQAVGLALAAEKFGAKFYGNGARPGIAIEVPGKLKQEAIDAMRRSFQEATGGENVHRPLVLTEGQKLTPFSVKPNEGQFIELREYQKEEICSIFGVHPYMIGQTEKANRSTAEQMSIEFVRFTLESHITAWEQELKRKLFPKFGRNANRYFAQFNTQQLLMPDAESQRAFFSSGKQWGFLSTNMILEWMGLNPIDNPDADVLYMPVNMAPMGASVPGSSTPSQLDDEDQPTKPALPAKNPRLPVKAQAASQALIQSLIRVYSQLFDSAFRRVQKQLDCSFDEFRQAFLPVFMPMARDFGGIAHCEALHCPHDELDELMPEFERSPFLSRYLTAMWQRLPQWHSANGKSEKLAQEELARAARAICISQFRAMAELKARALTEGKSEEEQARGITVNVAAPIVNVAPAQINFQPELKSHVDVTVQSEPKARAGRAVRRDDGTIEFVVEENSQRKLTALRDANNDMQFREE